MNGRFPAGERRHCAKSMDCRGSDSDRRFARPDLARVHDRSSFNQKRRTPWTQPLLSLVGKPWNKGKLVGQKAPLKVKDTWAIRVRLQIHGRTRDLALFDLGIDSKLRGCDLVRLRVRDVCHGDRVSSRAIVLQQKTQRPVQFEITPSTRDAVEVWIKSAALRADDYLFPSRRHASPHLGTRQYARIVHRWVAEIDLDPAAYGRTRYDAPSRR